MGEMSWASEGEPELYNINVPESLQRRGIATHLWNKAHELARGNTSLIKQPTFLSPDDEWGGDNPREYNISAPVHSPFRTVEGDLWAKSTPQKVPPLSNGQFWEHF